MTALPISPAVMVRLQSEQARCENVLGELLYRGGISTAWWAGPTWHHGARRAVLVYLLNRFA